jgi:hypothetical protein
VNCSIGTGRNGQRPKGQLIKKSTCQKGNPYIK